MTSILVMAFTVFAYLIGSIPFGYLLVKWSGKGDVRSIGSGGTGATNAMRAGGKWIALLTLFLDAGKGIVAAILSYLPFLTVDHIDDALNFCIAVAGALFIPLAALLGHMYPAWLGWRGGKGFASFIGLTIMYSYLYTGLPFILLGTWIIIFLVTRISSLSALTGILLANIALWVEGNHLCYIYSALSLLVIFAHRGNIARMLKGEEHRFSFSKK